MHFLRCILTSWLYSPDNAVVWVIDRVPFPCGLVCLVVRENSGLPAATPKALHVWSPLPMVFCVPWMEFGERPADAGLMLEKRLSHE